MTPEEKITEALEQLEKTQTLLREARGDLKKQQAVARSGEKRDPPPGPPSRP